jgi:hypothetical protein
LDVADGVDLRIATQENLDMALPTIGTDFQFATNGAEDQTYGFSYSSMKPAAHESSITDAFLITGLPNGSLFYNAGSLAAPHYFHITLFGADPYAANALELRITGVFIDGVKVSGSDGNLYWTPQGDSTVSAPGASSITLGTHVAAAGFTNIVTVQAVDNVDGIFNNIGAGADVPGNTGTQGAAGSYGQVNILPPPPGTPTVSLTNDTTNGASPSYATDHITSDASVTFGTPTSGSVIEYNLNGGGWVDNMVTPYVAPVVEAAYTLDVREYNAVLATSGTVATLNFTLDTTAPAMPTLALVDSTDSASAFGNVTHDTDLVTNNPTPLVTPASGADSAALKMYSTDAGATWATTVTLATDGSADGAQAVQVYQIDIAGNIADNSANASVALNFTLDTQADYDATPATVTLASTAIGPPKPVVHYTIDGLDADAHAVLTFTSSNGGTPVTATWDSTANTVDETANLTGLLSGTISVTMDITDYANNTATGTPSGAPILTIPPTPDYQAVVYDATNETLTITGNNMLAILTGGGTAGVTDIAGQLTLNLASWDAGNSYTGTLAGDVDTAYVIDDHTLVLNLNGNEGFAPWNSPESGMAGYGSLDTIAFTNNFATDTAGYAFPDGTGAFDILGTANETAMPQTYTVNLGGDGVLFSETLGADAPGNTANVEVNGDYGGYSLVTVSGMSAAQVDVSGSVSYDGGDTNYVDIVASNHFDGHTTADSNNFTVDMYNHMAGYWWGGNTNTGNLDSTGNNGLPVIQFADGSVLITNVYGTDVLVGGAGDDQLIAGNSGDRLQGNAGNDLLIGGNGSDHIYGGSGDDVIYGGGNSNYLSGGTGNNIFVVGTADNARNTIADWNAGDKIDISGATISDFVTFDGTGNVNGGAGISQSGNDTLIVLGANDSIRLLGVTMTNLTDANFDNQVFTYGNGGHTVG